MSNKPEIKDLLGLAEPATKLIEIVSGAIGTIYEPRKIKKLADAEAYRIQKLTTTVQETNFNGEIEFLDGKIKINSNNVNDIEIKSLIVNEVKRLFNENENIKRIADFAYNELENDNIELSEDIDEDWKNNFFDKSKKIYSEDLQFIFGKILAGEIRQPGTYSKRLLNILSNLSQKEATLFNKISKYVLKDSNNSFIISDREILSRFDITIEDIIDLEEAGLINSNPLNVSGTNMYQYKGYLITFFEQQPKLRIYCLTNSGKDLEKILNQEISIDYLLEIKKKYNINKMNYSFIVERKINGDQITYSLSKSQEI